MLFVKQNALKTCNLFTACADISNFMAHVLTQTYHI